MSINRVGGYSARVDHTRGPVLQPVQLRQADMGRPAVGAASLVRSDQVSFSADSRSLNRLVRTWGALSSLFGAVQPQQAGPGWDLSGLREALAEARRNAAVMDQRRKVMDTLKTSALRQAETLVEQYYGLQGDGAPLRVVFDENLQGALASVSFTYDRQGRMANQSLHVDPRRFMPDAGPNGTNDHVIQNDRIIAHEMTHVVMGRSMDMAALPDWFAEGTAEYISGGAERVGIVLQQSTPSRLMDRLTQPWEGDSSQYAAAYIAVRYLDEATATGGGLKAIMGRLKEGNSLDKAITTVSDGQFESTRHFLQELTAGGQGAAFLRTIDLSGRDAGSIKPGSGNAVVADTGYRTEQPLRNFRVQWPSLTEGLAPRFPAFVGFGPTPLSAAVAAYRFQVNLQHSRS